MFVCVYLWSLTLKQLEVDLSDFMAAFQAPEPAKRRNPLIEGKDGEESKGVQFIKQIEYNVVS